jgi:putative ABC transport system substrate-binding protein
MNNRREMIIALGACALTTPLASLAQLQAKIWRVGYLTSRSRQSELEFVTYQRLLPSMRDLGYVEGKNLIIESRFADGKAERLPALAVELVGLPVDVIVANGTPATRAAQQATKTIPIVMIGAGDPIGSGFIATLARPGGNITGLTNMSVELGAKRLELLVGTVPKITRIAVLLNSSNPTRGPNFEAVQNAGRKLRVPVVPLEVGTLEDIELAFSTMMKQRGIALVLQSDQLFSQHRSQIVALAAKAKIPAIYGTVDLVEAGGLMSYGMRSDNSDNSHRVATYVDKILKGAKPADIPVEQPTRFELAINMKTAKALGIKIPNSILVRAETVIK